MFSSFDFGSRAGVLSSGDSSVGCKGSVVINLGSLEGIVQKC